MKFSKEDPLQTSLSEESSAKKSQARSAMFDDLFVESSLSTHSDSFRYSLYGSLILHLSCIILATVEFFSSAPLQKTIRVPTKAIVRTVKLNPAPSFSQSSSEIIADSLNIEKKEQPISIQPPIEEPQHKDEVVQETHQSEAPSPAPEKKEAKPAPKPQSSKETKKKSEVKKPEEKKTTSSHPKKKNEAPKTKENTKTIKKETKNASGKSATKKKDPEPDIDSSLLAEALQSLDSTSSYIQSGGGKGSKSSAGNSSRKEMKMIGELQAERGGLQAMDGSEDFTDASPEGWYVSDLIRRLQLNIRLLEPGTVRISLSIGRKGELIDCSITQCSNASTKSHLQKALLQIKFAPFGQAFKKEEKHTFRLKLEDNGTWSI